MTPESFSRCKDARDRVKLGPHSFSRLSAAGMRREHFGSSTRSQALGGIDSESRGHRSMYRSQLSARALQEVDFGR